MTKKQNKALAEILKEIEDWDNKLVFKYKGRSCVMCGLSKEGIQAIAIKAFEMGIKDTRSQLLTEILEMIEGIKKPSTNRRDGDRDLEYFAMGYIEALDDLKAELEKKK